MSDVTPDTQAGIKPGIKPCLWFHAEAEEAAHHYASIFANSAITSVMRAAPGGPAIAVELVLDGQPFLAINGREREGFTDACSFVVPCDTQADIDRYWEALTRGGEEGQCGWLKDRYGVSWQVVPRTITALLGGPDPAAAGRAMQAMLAMRKLDVAALERARGGGSPA